MNIEQVKRDLDAGIQVSKPTLLKLAEAAQIMNYALDLVTKCTASQHAAEFAKMAINEVSSL